MFITDEKEVANSRKAKLFVLCSLITVALMKFCSIVAVANTVNLPYKYCSLQEMEKVHRFLSH